jgi:hypothetical protein
MMTTRFLPGSSQQLDVGNRIAVNQQQVGERIVLDHAELAGIGIAWAGQRQQLGVVVGRHFDTSAGVYQRASLASIAAVLISYFFRQLAWGVGGHEIIVTASAF